MIVHAANDLGNALILAGLSVAGICVLALLMAWLMDWVMPQPASHRAAVARRRARVTRGQRAGTRQLRT